MVVGQWLVLHRNRYPCPGEVDRFGATDHADREPAVERHGGGLRQTFKRDYAQLRPRPDAATVIEQLDDWFEHYNTVHPHKALRYRSPREFRSLVKRGPTDFAAGAPRRPHHNELSADGIGSSPQAARSAETRSVWLDASMAVDQP